MHHARSAPTSTTTAAVNARQKADDQLLHHAGNDRRLHERARLKKSRVRGLERHVAGAQPTMDSLNERSSETRPGPAAPKTSTQPLAIEMRDDLRLGCDRATSCVWCCRNAARNTCNRQTGPGWEQETFAASMAPHRG